MVNERDHILPFRHEGVLLESKSIEIKYFLGISFVNIFVKIGPRSIQLYLGTIQKAYNKIRVLGYIPKGSDLNNTLQNSLISLIFHKNYII